MANKIVGRVGAKVKIRTDKQIVNQYEKAFEKGRRLSFNELRGMKAEIRDAYTGVISKEDKELGNYINEI